VPVADYRGIKYPARKRAVVIGNKPLVDLQAITLNFRLMTNIYAFRAGVGQDSGLLLGRMERDLWVSFFRQGAVFLTIAHHGAPKWEGVT